MNHNQLVKQLGNKNQTYKNIEYKENCKMPFYRKYHYCVYFVSNSYLNGYFDLRDKNDFKRIHKNNHNAEIKLVSQLRGVLDKYDGLFIKSVYGNTIAIYTNNLEIYQEIFDSTDLKLSYKKPVVIRSVTEFGKIYLKRSTFSYRIMIADKSYDKNEICKLIEFKNNNVGQVKFSPKLEHRVHSYSHCKTSVQTMYIYGGFIDVKSEKLTLLLSLLFGNLIKKKFEIVTDKQ